MRAAVVIAALALAAPVAAEPAPQPAAERDKAKRDKAERDKAEPAAKRREPAPQPAAERREPAPQPAARAAADTAAGKLMRALERAAETEATRPAPAPPRVLDLRPRGVLEKAARGDRRGAERSPGLSLGDDGDWKVHAAQIGVMAAGFAALSALCSGGSCMLPEGATDWIPGMGQSDPPSQPVDLRDSGSLRSAR